MVFPGHWQRALQGALVGHCPYRASYLIESAMTNSNVRTVKLTCKSIVRRSRSKQWRIVETSSTLGPFAFGLWTGLLINQLHPSPAQYKRIRTHLVAPLHLWQHVGEFQVRVEWLARVVLPPRGDALCASANLTATFGKPLLTWQIDAHSNGSTKSDPASCSVTSTVPRMLSMSWGVSCILAAFAS